MDSKFIIALILLVSASLLNAAESNKRSKRQGNHNHQK